MAIATTGDGQTELRLSPEELGSVRLNLRTTEHGLTVHIQAERGDTDSLIRRSISELGQELRDLGYRDVRFDFGQAPQDRRNNPPGSPGGASARTATDLEPAPPDGGRPRAVSSGHLDIRL